MRKVTVEGIEINFNDLTVEKQKELYEKNKKKYKQDAINSIYSLIRSLVARNETESSKILNEMLRKEVRNGKNSNVEDAIFGNAIFQLEEETIKELAESADWNCRIKAATLSKDSKFLNEMLRKELINEQDRDVEYAIFDNKFFELEEETIKELAESADWNYRIKAATLSKDSKFLNEMLRKELINEQDRDVEYAIFDNKFFEIEEETIKELAESADWDYRRKAATLSKDSKFLNEMLRKELINEQDRDVEYAIFDNKFFEIEEETIKELAESADWNYRIKVAILSTDSKFLNEMLRREVRNEQDSDVEDAIFDNKFFEIEEETIKELAESTDWNYRRKAAIFSKDSKFLNEMLRREVRNEQDGDVENAIFNNEFFEIEEETAKQLVLQDNSYYRKKIAELSKDSKLLLEIFIREIEKGSADIQVLRTIIKNDKFPFKKTEV